MRHSVTKTPRVGVRLGSLMLAERGRIASEAPALTRSEAHESFPSSGLQALSQEPLQIPFAVGEVIADKYEVVGLLGTGGMGYVISARHTELGEMVALKFLRPEAWRTRSWSNALPAKRALLRRFAASTSRTSSTSAPSPMALLSS